MLGDLVKHWTPVVSSPDCRNANSGFADPANFKLQTSNFPPLLPSISIIVCTFRRNRVLCETLGHIRPQLTDIAELIVVDQQADHDEPTAKFLAQANRDGWIRYYNRGKPGLTAARNFGASVAQGDILLYADDDIVPCDGWMSHHLENYTEPQVAAVAGQVLHLGESTADAPGAFNHEKRIDSFHGLYGANFSIRKSVFESVGGADEHLGVHAYTEDVLLAHAVRERGYIIRYEPAASVLHLKDSTGGCRITDQTQPTREFERSHSKLYLYHKLAKTDDPRRWRALWDGLRHGPLRRQNIVRPWRQPLAWCGFLKAFVKAAGDSRG